MAEFATKTPSLRQRGCGQGLVAIAVRQGSHSVDWQASRLGGWEVARSAVYEGKSGEIGVRGRMEEQSRATGS